MAKKIKPAANRANKRSLTKAAHKLATHLDKETSPTKKDSKNANLHKAKIAKDDEYYTMLADIESEMEAYLEKNADVFHNKTVLCPCDDPTWSMFTVWFVNNFRRIGLKKLICTGYHKGGHGVKYVLDGDTNGNGRIDVGDIVAEDMEGDGDFRSAEVAALLPEVDFIITNFNSNDCDTFTNSSNNTLFIYSHN